VCGCTEEEPCVYADPLDGQPRACAWIEDDLCSGCDYMSEVPALDGPRVELYSPGEADAYIRERRAMAAGGVA
jgi:hypothetical protein